MNLIENSFTNGILNHQNLEIIEPTEFCYMLVSSSLPGSGEDIRMFIV